MKKLLLSLLASTLLFSNSGTAQIMNHPQSFGSYGWGVKDNSNIVVCVGKYSESYILNYDLSTGDYTYLNDNNSNRLSSFLMIGDAGIAKTGSSVYYYTNDNWKTYTPSTFLTSVFDKVITTSSGIITRKKISNFYSEYFHSTDFINWKSITTAYTYPLSDKDGTTWIISTPNNFLLSTDGGLTFINKTPVGAPSVSFTDFVPLTSSSGIGFATTGKWYYTNDSGDTWTAFATFPTAATFIYAANLDAIYVNFLNTGVHVSVDKGITWQPTSILNTTSRIYPVGDYFITGVLSWSEGIGQPWRQLHLKTGGGNDVSFFNNKGVMVGDSGFYSYTHDKGKTYIKGASQLGTQDLKACEVFNESLMMVGDRQSNIYVSDDAGLTWNKRYSNGVNWISRKFRASADLSTIVLFRNGQNLYSKNQGLNWSILGSLGGAFDGTVTPAGKVLIISGANILEMNKSNGSTSIVKTFTEPNVQGVILEMVDENIGYVIATNATDKTTIIFKTTDGWATYTKTGTINSLINLAPNPYLPAYPYGLTLALNIVGTETLYINGYQTSDSSVSSNTIYKSYDGGATWITETFVPYNQGSSPDRLQGMHYFGNETFVSVWEDGRIVQNTSDSTTLSIAQESKLDKTQTVIVYPNPTSSLINLQSNENIEQINLMDISGKIMHSEQLKTNVHQLNISALPSGIYFLKIKTDNTTETKKIVKQN